MNALDIILAHGKLPLVEQDKVSQILMGNATMRQALVQSQKDLSDALSEGEPEETNVIQFPPRKGNSGRQMTPNGPMDLVRQFIQNNPKGSCRECKDWAKGINPSLHDGSLGSMFYKLRSELKRAA